MLNDLLIASPCPNDWNRMVGDDQVRFCNDCQKHVYNLSEMTRQQAERLVRDFEGHLCVSLYRRADGTVMTSDCPDRHNRRSRHWLASGMVLVFLLLLGILTLIGVVSAGDGTRANLRRIEPFRLVLDWIDPQPVRVMGGL